MTEINNDSFWEEMKTQDKEKSSVMGFIPLAYVQAIEHDFLNGIKIICHPPHAPKFLMQRGERFDWTNNFYERVLPKNNNIQGTSKNNSSRRKGIYDPIKCYVKD